MDEQTKYYRCWEYSKKGDYHKNLDPDWSYTPTYLFLDYFAIPSLAMLNFFICKKEE